MQKGRARKCTDGVGQVLSWRDGLNDQTDFMRQLMPFRFQQPHHSVAAIGTEKQGGGALHDLWKLPGNGGTRAVKNVIKPGNEVRRAHAVLADVGGDHRQFADQTVLGGDFVDDIDAPVQMRTRPGTAGTTDQDGNVALTPASKYQFQITFYSWPCCKGYAGPKIIRSRVGRSCIDGDNIRVHLQASRK